MAHVDHPHFTQTLSQLLREIHETIATLPPTLPCWLVVDCAPPILAQAERAVKATFSDALLTRLALLPATGLSAFDYWLDHHWRTPSMLLHITLVLHAQPQQGEAEAITAALFTNRKAAAFLQAAKVHRFEQGTCHTLDKTLAHALLWANLTSVPAGRIWLSGPIADSTAVDHACYHNALTLHLAENRCPLDFLLGYSGMAAPWLAIMLADAEAQAGKPQLVVVQPEANAAPVWLGAITREEPLQE